MTKIPTNDIPQANSLGLAGDLLALIHTGIQENSRLSPSLGIVRREVDYYKRAICILGLAEKRGRNLRITSLGQTYLEAKKPNEKKAVLREAVLQSNILKKLLDTHKIDELVRPNIVAFFSERTRLTGTTLGRRADCIISWLRQTVEIDPEDLVSFPRKISEQRNDEFAKYEKREEGPLHRKLKESIRDRSRELLGEELKLIEEEYQFPTNDRADIVFLDSKGKYLAIEVEVDVAEDEFAGLLQAVKYKEMLKVLLGLPLESVGGMLVARSIHLFIRDRAERYGIEVREITGVI